MELTPQDIDTCTICNKPFELHPGNNRPTCMFHGNPSGSPFEQRLFAVAIKRHEEQSR